MFGDTGLDEGAEVGRLGAVLGALNAPLPGSRVASTAGVGTRARAGVEAGPSGSPAELRRSVLEKEGRKRGTPEGGRSDPRGKGKAARR